MAEKLFAFLRDPDGRDITATQDRLRAALAARDSPFAKAIRLSFCRIGPIPQGLPRRPDDAQDRPAYDAAIRAEFANATDAETAFATAGKSTWLDSLSAALFLVTPIPVLDRMTPGQKPAIKNLALIEFHDDLPDSACQRSWAQHAKLAGEIHAGAGRYVRNWVERRSAGAPPARGIVEIDFATLPDLIERYYDGPGAMARIIQDVGHFVRKGTRLFMQEEVLR